MEEIKEIKITKPFKWLEEKNIMKISSTQILNFCEFHNILFRPAHHNDLDGGHFTSSTFDIKMMEYGLVRLGVNWSLGHASMVLVRLSEIENTIDQLILTKPEVIKEFYNRGQNNYKNPKSESYNNMIESYIEFYEMVLLELRYREEVTIGFLNIYVDALDLMLDYYESKIK